MEEVELEESVRETFAVEEIDMDYEFDAAKFFDFSRVETDSEAGEAERWFETSRNYPPSRRLFLQNESLLFQSLFVMNIFVSERKIS